MEKLPPTFWPSVFLGAALIIIIYIVYKNAQQREGFNASASTGSTGATVTPASTGTTSATVTPAGTGTTGATVTPTETTSATVTPISTYVETRSDIPEGDSLVFYLTSFSSDSEGAKAGTSPLYSFGTNRWKNWCNKKIVLGEPSDFDFTLVPFSGSLPNTIYQKGLPTKNIKLSGPSSFKLDEGSFPYTVGPFSMVIYGKLGPLVFDTPAPLVLWSVQLETPDTVRLTIDPIPGSSTNIMVSLRLGRTTDRYQWNLPAATLMGTGLPVSYSLVYDPAAKTANFYIGALKYTAKPIQDAANRLGNSYVEVNSDGRLDMSLSALMYFNKVLTDANISSIGNYLNKQQSGLPATLQLQQLQTNVQISSYVSEIQSTSNIVQDLSGQLEQCRLAAAAAAAASNVLPSTAQPLQWQIQAPSGFPTGFIDAETLKKCTPILINQYGNTGNVPPKRPGETVGPTQPPKISATEGDSVWRQMKSWFA